MWRQPLLWLGVMVVTLLLLINRMPLLDSYTASLDARKFFPSINEGWRLVGLLSLLFAAYWRVIHLIRTGRWRPRLLTMASWASLLLLLSALIYPFNANDIYRYVLRGRITAQHGGNPFVDPPSLFPADSFYRLAGEWVDFTSPYGPLWELLAPLPVLAFPGRPLAQLLGFKLLTAAAHLLIGLLIAAAYRGTEEGDLGRLPAAAWLFNPALLLIFAADGHNDSLMILMLVGGWVGLDLGVRRQRWSWAACGLVLMGLAPLVKVIGLLPLPLFAIYAWRKFPAQADRFKILGGALLGGLAVTAILFLPFGFRSEMVERLIDEGSAGASFTPIALAILLQIKHGTPTFNFWENLSLYGTLAGALWLAWRVWRGRSPLQAAADLFFLFLLLAFNFRLWYTAWPFPFLLLDRRTSEARLAAGHLFLWAGQVSVFIFAHLHRYHYDLETLETYRVGVPFVFVLPPLLAWGISIITVHRWRSESPG